MTAVDLRFLEEPARDRDGLKLSRLKAKDSWFLAPSFGAASVLRIIPHGMPTPYLSQQSKVLTAAPQAFHCPSDSGSLDAIAKSLGRKQYLKQARFILVLKR
jgi:hypothetical protein